MQKKIDRFQLEMAKNNYSKEEDLRKRVYKFYNENKALGKIHTVKHFMAENVPRRTIYSIIKRSEYLTIKRKPGSGRIAKKMEKRKVNQLVKSFNHKDGISQRQAAKKFNIHHSYVSYLLKKRGVKARKKIRIPARSEEQKKVNRAKCRNLFLKNPKISWVLDDESYGRYLLATVQSMAMIFLYFSDR